MIGEKSLERNGMAFGLVGSDSDSNDNSELGDLDESRWQSSAKPTP
jgi:hypothetical protein